MLFSGINILGLAIGIATCLLILHYVNFEKSYDRFHENSDRIYRLRYERTSEDGSAVRFASCCPPAGGLIRERYPEVEKIARLFRYRAVVSHNNIKFTEDRMYFAEPDLFSIFKFKILHGSPFIDLDEPNKAFISQSAAQKYFGDQDPLGKILSVDKKHDYQIVGTFEDLPHNSHIKFNIILPFKNLVAQFGPEYTEAWGHTGMYTYLRLKPETDLKEFRDKLQSLVDAEFGEVLKEYNMIMELPLQPLSDIHLHSHFMQEYEVNGNADAVNFLFIIALFIIIIAWVNYINLSTARSLTRAKEVGLRKVVGASRKQVLFQFLFETSAINLIAVIIALILVKITLPFFSNLTGTPLEYSIWMQNWFWYALVVLFIAGIFFSGLYPVIALSSFEPVKVLRGKIGNSTRGVNLRKALIVFQFVMALFLMIGTFTVYGQIRFMQNQELGFDIEQVLVVKAPRVRTDSFGDKIVTFKQSLQNNSNIEKFCVVTEVPGRQIYWDAGGIMKAGEDISKSKNYQIVGVDYDFIDVFDIELVAGRNFSEQHRSDENALLLNETAIAWMGFESPQAAMNQQVDYWGKIYNIIGVVKDYHQQSLKEAFEPHIFRLMLQGRGNRAQFAVKINTQDVKKTIKLVEHHYSQFFPGNPFDYFFLDEYYNQQYKADQLFGKVFGVFSFLSIFVTSLGILGLAAFMAAQRTKEIGIRKVLGARVSLIFLMLTRDFLILLLISFIISLPISILGINTWLDLFASKMNPGVSIFIMPLILVALVTIITVSTHALKAAFANPVEALRYE
jgi:putative ABC transport system permease protein